LKPNSEVVDDSAATELRALGTFRAVEAEIEAEFEARDGV